MKHVKRISVNSPSKAAIWQDIACTVTTLFANVVDAKGGASPLVDVVFNKCHPAT